MTVSLRRGSGNSRSDSRLTLASQHAETTEAVLEARRAKEDICQRGKKSIERAMLMELLYRFCQIAQPEIGRLVGGIDYSAVSQARKRSQIRLEREPKLKKKLIN